MRIFTLNTGSIWSLLHEKTCLSNISVVLPFFDSEMWLLILGLMWLVFPTLDSLLHPKQVRKYRTNRLWHVIWEFIRHMTPLFPITVLHSSKYSLQILHPLWLHLNVPTGFCWAIFESNLAAVSCRKIFGGWRTACTISLVLKNSLVLWSGHFSTKIMVVPVKMVLRS